MNIPELLRATHSPDAALRNSAESQISESASTDPAALLEGLFAIAEDPGADTPIAQSAVLVTKTVVQQHWGPGFEQFKGPIWPETIREAVRTKLLQIMETTQRPLIRAAIGSVIGRIGSLEYPDEWPVLVPRALELLGNENTLANGLSLLKELLADTVRESDFFESGQLIMDRLYSAATNREFSLPAIECFHECINFFLMGDDDQLPILETVAKGYIRQWDALFAQLISTDASAATQNEIIGTLNDISSAFPTLVAPDIPTLFETVLVKLEQSSSDSKSGAHQEVLSTQLAFLEFCIESQGGRSIVQSLSDEDTLKRLVTLCVRFSEVPPDLQHLWADDFNEFVTHEADLATDKWPRPSAGMLISVLRSPSLLRSLYTEAEAASSWMRREACLFLISQVLHEIAIESQTLSTENIEGLIRLVEATASEALLRARQVITAGDLAKYLNNRVDDATKLRLVSSAMNITEASRDVEKIASLKTIAVACDLFPQEVRQYQQQFFSLVASLVPDAEEETPSFLVDVFLSVIRVDFETAIQTADVFALFFSLVEKDVANIELNVELLTVVEEMLSWAEGKPDALNLIMRQLLAPVFRILNESRTSDFEFTSELQFALDLSSVVFERVQDIPDQAQLMDIFYDLLSTSQDNQILQAGSSAYAVLLERVGHDSKVSGDALQKMLSVAAKLLDPALDDQAGLASGRLVSAMIENFSSQLSGVLDEVVVATARRLAAASNALLLEGLTLVFCQLVLKNAAGVIDLLARNDLLEPVMDKWLTTFGVVRGIDEIHQNITALQALYNLNDPRLAAIVVNDEPIVPRDVIITRSKAKNLQFTKVSLPVKIIKLLIKELGQAPAPADGDGYGEDDDDWDDELTFGPDGQNQIDARTYRLILDWIKEIGQRNMDWYAQLTEQERATLLEASQQAS